MLNMLKLHGLLRGPFRAERGVAVHVVDVVGEGGVEWWRRAPRSRPDVKTIRLTCTLGPLMFRERLSL